MAYQNAIASIKASANAGPLLSADQLKGLPRVGAGTLRRIDEIIRTGNLSEVDDVKKDPRMSELVNVHGFGPVAALNLSKKGILTVDALRAKADSLSLTSAQKIGLKYHEQISRKIPHDEVTQHDHLLQNAAETFSSGALKLVVCGSYRRNVTTSSDVDALLTPKCPTDEAIVAKTPELQLESFVEYLQSEVQYVLDRIALGSTKFMGVAAIPGGTPRRVDIRFVTHAQFPPALLYFTGSKGFNVKMRSHALERGYLLNEYGLFTHRQKPSLAAEKKKVAAKPVTESKSRTKRSSKEVAAVDDKARLTAELSLEDDSLERVPVATEEDIFKIIKMDYVSPEQRQ